MPPPATCATARRGRPEAYPKGRPNPQDPKGGASATPRHTALRRGGGDRRPTRRAAPTPLPAGPQGRRRRHLSSPCATARRERPEAYPRGRPYCQKSDPAPPEIGRGSKRALTHPPDNLTASCEAAGEPRPPSREPPGRPPQGRFKAGPGRRVGQLRVDPRRYNTCTPPYYYLGWVPAVRSSAAHP